MDGWYISSLDSFYSFFPGNGIKKAEDAVEWVSKALDDFMNSYDTPDPSRLYNISSGAPVSADIEPDVLGADAAGETRMKDRLFSNQVNFFAPIKKLKLKTMAAPKPKRITTQQALW